MFLCAVLRFSDPPLRPSIMLSFSDGHKKIRMHVDVVEIRQTLPVNYFGNECQSSTECNVRT